MSKRLRGVFAAVATASTADREVDCAKSIALGHYLLQRLRWLERDMSYAREVAAISPDFDVFPSTEAVLLEARDGAFAGCISAKWKRLMPLFAPFPDVDNKAAVTAYDKVRAT